MWRELFNAPWPDDANLLPTPVHRQATARIYSYWRSRGWQFVAGEVILWVAVYSRDIPHPNVYALLAACFALIYLIGLLPARFTAFWLMGTVTVFLLQGMLISGLGPVTALSYMVPYTIASILLVGRPRLVIQAWCVVAFWVSLIYEVSAIFPRLNAPRYIWVSYDILLAAFTFQTLRFLNQLAVELNTAYVEAEVRHQSHQFLARVSHELRTPLNSVLGFAKLLRRGQLTPTQQDYLNQVIDEGELLNRLVSDLLDSAHLSTGRVSLKREPCDLNAICRAVLDEHRPHVSPDVALHLDLAPDLVPVHGDPVRLRQVVGNLVSNAAKHTRQGEICVITRSRGDRVQVAVRDTGPGIPEEQQALIFVPFVQIDARSTGVGLGLDIALQLVRLHGGTIQLQSVVGQGSTFTVELPGGETGGSQTD